jgi:hypothetical protein
MIYLSYFLYASLGAMLLPYISYTIRVNETTNSIRSLSGVIAKLRPYGHFLMSLGNLLIFLVLSMDTQIYVAWIQWVFLQLVLAFDVDQYKAVHGFFVSSYVAFVVLFWIRTCQRYDLWQYAGTPVASSLLFILLFIYNAYNRNPVTGATPLGSLQSLVELVWIVSNAVLVGRYEEYIHVNYNVTSHTLIQRDF